MHYLFVDLDDTLFQSRRKTPDESGVVAVAHGPDGVPNGFMTRRQQDVFGLLSGQMILIPVTARDLEAFRRVKVPQQSFAVLDYGGVILDPSGAPVPEWMEYSRGLVADASDWMDELQQNVNRFIARESLRAICRPVFEFGLAFYLVMKYREGDSASLDRVQQEVILPWFDTHRELARVHRNGNNLAVLPKGLDKRPAVEFVQQELRTIHPDLITWGMGDSDSDLEFITACDYSILPANTQASRRLRSA
jgi:hydroxymethylpyrimidine pyrophosphatase-like HAD family hydrolase